MSQPPIDTSASEDAYTDLTSMEAVEKEARARQDARIREQEISTRQKQEELAAITKTANEKHSFLESEQDKLAKKRARDINHLIEEAKARQEQEHQAKMRDIKQKRDEIHWLQQESEKKFNTMSPEQRERRGKELHDMMNKALQKYKELESEQERIIHEDQQKLVQLAQQMDVEKRKLQKEQTEQLKTFLADIVDSAAKQQQQLKEQFHTIVEQEKTDLNDLTSKAGGKYREMLEIFTAKMEENKKYVKTQLELSKKLITEGKVNDALRLRAELQRKTYDLQNVIHREQNQFASRIRMSLIEFEQEVNTDAKTMQHRHDGMIEQVKGQMDTDAKEEMSNLQQEFLSHTKDSLMVFEDSVLSQNRQVQLEQLLAIKKLKEQMEKQSSDTIRRQQEQQNRLFNQTLKLVEEIERQSKTNQKIVEHGQSIMMSTAKSSVSEMQEKSRTAEKDMYREQQEMMERGYQETLSMVKEVREKQRQEREETTRQFMNQRLSISREASDIHKQLQEEQMAVAVQLQEERIETGRDLQDKLLKLQQDRQELTKYEVEKAAELGQQAHEEQAKVTGDYEDELQEARQKYKETIKELNERQKLLLDDQKKLEDLIFQMRRQRMESAEKKESQKDIMMLIERAKLKQKEIKRQQKETSKSAHAEMERCMEEATNRRKDKRQEVRKSYELALAEHERDVRIRDETLRLAQQLLMREQEGDLEAVMAKIDSYLSTYRSHRKKIINEVQEKLKTLEGDYIAKRQGSDPQ